VRAGAELAHAQVYDIAPTVLRLLGLPSASDFAGRVLDEAFDPAALGPQAASIPSYDAFGGARFEGNAGPDLSREEIERLRALGYL
jgi:arylsulfatase A-like enzyme